MRIFVAALCLVGLCGSLHSQSILAQPDLADAKSLKLAESSYKVAQKQFKKSPNAANKKALVVATDRYALTSMMTSALPTKVKYRQSLKLYREVLKIDPNNYEAKRNSDTIISIYKSMHRPVPK